MRWIQDPAELRPGNYAWKAKSQSPVHLCIVSIDARSDEVNLNGWWLGPLENTLYVYSEMTKKCENCYYYSAKGKGKSTSGLCSFNPPVDNNWSNPFGRDKACSNFVFKV